MRVVVHGSINSTSRSSDDGVALAAVGDRKTGNGDEHIIQ